MFKLLAKAKLENSNFKREDLVDFQFTCFFSFGIRNTNYPLILASGIQFWHQECHDLVIAYIGKAWAKQTM